MSIRSPLVVVVGHVDHGKSSILDSIRGTSIVQSEAGAITQAIGASIIPMDTIRNVCGGLLDQMKQEYTIPGLLFIDTPGHAAFTSLRKRGGNLADIAILVVDMNEGFKPQTIEAIEILKSYKTPFVIAANKVDLIAGWKSHPEMNMIQNIKAQSPDVQQKFETKMYELIAKFYEFGFECERFDRLESFTKQLAIIPTSAKSKEGLPELMMVLTGLAQKFLEKNLEYDATKEGKGTILEVKEEQGLGTTIDLILYDGMIRKNDTIVIGSTDEPIVTKVRALLEPNPLAEMRDKKSKFKPINEAIAATGVKISAPDLDDVTSGMPVVVCNDKEKINEIKSQIQKEVDEIMINTEKEGILIKADALGGLEALNNLLTEKNIPIKKADIGPISKKDVAEAHSNLETDPLNCCILGFNVDVGNDVTIPKDVKIISNSIIYKLLEDFEEWRENRKKELEAGKLDEVTRPVKIQIMPNMTFRQNNPAICGTDVIAGVLKTNTPLMDKNGKKIATVKSIKHNNENVSRIDSGEQVAVAYEHLTIGRQACEGDHMYSFMGETEFRKLKDLSKFLDKKEIEILKEIAEIMRKDNPVWGV
ncbi:translation initiation factor IF-2 [Candidatus Woesearchaeota archaeon]|nr:MAG: translation initiation factor IF-2 [Candidatus Woesearchaeota archaeon]